MHWRNATSFHDVFRNLSPFYLTAEKDGHVVVVIRGTLFEDEWCVSGCGIDCWWWFGWGQGFAYMC